MRLGVDVMGGDNAPGEILAGCLEAVEMIEEGDVVVVAGQAELIRPAVESAGLASSNKIEILDTREVIAMMTPRSKPCAENATARSFDSRSLPRRRPMKTSESMPGSPPETRVPA